MDNQNRKTVLPEEGGYDITIFPQKLLQISSDFRKFFGPYIGDMEKFICLDETNTPVPDGTVVEFGIGETVSVLVPNSNFNTITESSCGEVRVQNGSMCTTKRDQNDFNLSKSCITLNSTNDYYPVEAFLKSGYLIDETNELVCMDSTGKKLDDKQCKKPFLTDYWEKDKIYDVDEELIINMGNTKTYISTESKNTKLPQTETWEEVSKIETVSFNTGQLLGESETYQTTTPGDIHLKPGWALEYITELKYRTDQEYNDTNSYLEAYSFSEFKKDNNFITPYLETREPQKIKFKLVDPKTNSPIIEIIPLFEVNENIFIDENYLNPLIWLMSSKNFLNNVTDGPGNKFSDLNNISFSLVDESNINRFNNTEKQKNTELNLYNTKEKNDLTGYYCYFIPFIADNVYATDVSSNSLFGIQWIYYIYNRMTSGDRTDQPCKFEVVYVTGMSENEGNHSIFFERNITQIDSSELFYFIDPVRYESESGQFGLFLPFSTNGPFPRIHKKDSFQISLTIPPGYEGFIDLPSSSGDIDVKGGKERSFFTYGITGFSTRNEINNPSGNNLVQYQPDSDRISCMSYIKHIRVIDGTGVYITEVKTDSQKKIFNVGDIVSFLGHDFTVFGIDPNILDESKDYYETFDYVCSPVNNSFYSEYMTSDMFPYYINIDKDRIFPSFYKGTFAGQFGYVIKQYFNILNPNTIKIKYQKVDGTYQIRNVQPNEVIFFKVRETDYQNKYLSYLNEGKAVLMKLSEIPILDTGGSIVVSKIVGKATGKMSLVKGNSYDNVLVGRSFIDTYSIKNTGSLTEGEKYNINGFNFMMNSTDNLAVVSIYAKSYTSVIPEYRDISKNYIKDELVLFKDYQNKIIYRNGGDSPQKFDPDTADCSTWKKNGSVHPQVNYKLYHEDQLYLKNDLVKYNNKLWISKNVLGLPVIGEKREPPSINNDSWTLFSPSGDLFSQLNFFTAVLGNLSFDNPSYIEQDIISHGDTHFFPDKKYYFNKTYCFDFSESKIIYFSSNGTVLSESYNWIEGNYIAEIRYYFDGNEVSRSDYITKYNERNDRKIKITVRRDKNSMLSLENISKKSKISFGTDVSTSGGTIYLYNNNDEISQSLIDANNLDNQNIPIRISDYGKYGHCFTQCIKNIEENAYSTEPYQYIDLIESGLISTWFNDQIIGYIAEDEKSFVSVPSEQCRSAVPIGDRYLTNCFTTANDDVKYCDYLYRIPTLTPEKYGVPYCTDSDNFFKSNSMFLYFIPMDIESQNFLSYKVVDAASKIINVDNYFYSKHEYSISGDQGIIKSFPLSYNHLGSVTTISSRKTYIIHGDFTKNIFEKEIFELEDSDSNKIILKVDQIGINITQMDLDITANKFDYCWVTDNQENVLFYGFIYNNTGDNYSTGDIYKLSYTDDLENYTPVSMKLSIFSTVLNQVVEKDITSNNRGPFMIEKFTISPGDKFVVNTPSVFSYGSFEIMVYVENNRVFQQGEVTYTGGDALSANDQLFYKYKRDQCICKIYSNYGGKNGFLSYLETDQIPDLSGESHVPIFNNVNKEGLLEPVKNEINILSGNKVIKSDTYMDTFIIENNTIKPNPIQKPFNLSSSSEFYPLLIGKNFGIVSSTTSSNLYTTPLSDFKLNPETDIGNFLEGLNGEKLSTVQSNQNIITSMIRLNKIRPNYSDNTRKCNIIIKESIINNVQASYEVVTSKFGFLEIKTGESEIDMYSNNSLLLVQKDKPRFPLLFFVDDSNIVKKKTKYPQNQYLSIKYFMDETEVNQDVYSNQSNLDSASTVRIEILYETELVANTVPVKDEITTQGRGSFSIKILENRIPPS